MQVELEAILDPIQKNPRLVIAEDYEIVVEHSLIEREKYTDGRRKHHSKEDQLWISLRLLHRKLAGHSLTRANSKEALDLLVNDAFEAAENSSMDPWFRLPLLKEPQTAEPQEPNPITPLESAYGTLSNKPATVEEMVSVCRTQTRLLRKGHKNPLAQEHTQSSLHYSVLNEAHQEWVRDSRTHSGDAFDKKEILGQLVEKVSERAGSRQWNGTVSGSTSLLFEPKAVAGFLAHLAPWFYADRVQKGRSPFSKSSEPPRFSHVLTIVDDGTYQEGAAPFDIEGTPSKKTVLVEKGALKQCLHNYYTATRENRLSTGNFIHLPHQGRAAIGPTQFYVEPSQRSNADLLNQVTNGFLLQDVDFVGEVAGRAQHYRLEGPAWKVDEGKKTLPIPRFQFEINAFALLQAAVAVGDDLTFHGSFGGPSILFENVPLV